MLKIFGREPALWAGLINVAVYLLGATVFKLSTSQEAVVIAVAAAVLGIVVALSTHDGVSAAILGFIKAVIALALGFGLKLSPDNTALILSVLATFSAMFVRTQATAKVAATPFSVTPAPAAPATPRQVAKAPATPEPAK
jgi:hypothetical protein